MQKTVLLIESDTSFARAMSNALEARGFGVRTSSDGKEGFELARALHPDCVVLCVELPGLSGYSWCNRLKKDGDLKGIPLVITSSEATPETFDQHRKLKTRAEDYLLKPFPPETLVDRIGALVGLPDRGGADEDLVTLDDVELDVASPAATPAAEEDADLRMLDEAFDSISRGGDEPGARRPGAAPSEPPLTLMPDADEAPALSALDREMEAALASLAEEAAEASKADPFAPTHAAGTVPALHPPSTRRIEARVESVAEDETPVLLEDVEVLPAFDENAAAALRAAQEEAGTLRVEVDALQAEAGRLRDEGDALRDEAVRLREEGDVLRADAEQVRAQAEAAAGLASAREEELAGLTARLAEAGASASARAEELVEATRRTEDLERELENSRAAAEGLRAEIESLRSSADGVRGEAASLQNEVATLRATLDAARTEADGNRAEVDRLRTEAEGLRTEADRFRSEAEGLRAEADQFRSEAEGLRAEADAFRAEAEDRATETSRRLLELEGRAAEQEERAQRAQQRLRTDEKVREKTRRALAMVLQILEERSAGDGGAGGSAPPAAP